MVLLLIILPIAVEELTVLFTAEQVRPYRLHRVSGAGALVVHAFCTQFRGFRIVAASTLAFIVVFVMLFAARAAGLDAAERDGHRPHGRHGPGNALPRRTGVVSDGDPGEALGTRSRVPRQHHGRA